MLLWVTWGYLLLWHNLACPNRYKGQVVVSDSQIREGKNEGDVENVGDVETAIQM